MSRSYKKQPWVTDHKRRSTKKSKALANRKFRRKMKQDENVELPIPRSCSKRTCESWNICDYKWRMTEQEAVDWYYETQPSKFKTLEDWMRYWAKCHVRK